jgi:hypothetical protein
MMGCMLVYKMDVLVQLITSKHSWSRKGAVMLIKQDGKDM